MEICTREMCTGCCCCMNICPKDAITMVNDELGKTIPQINEDNCTECRLCIERCPMNTDKGFYAPRKCYALWTKNDRDRSTCASGGVATGFSRVVLRNSGTVFGTSFNHELTLVHSMAETEEELEMFKGSKYVQSCIGYNFRQVKKQLKSGRQVLFIGTPCQIDGLNKYLNKDYEKLITVDLICHGTPPMKYLNEYINSVNKNRRLIVTNISFRGRCDFHLMVMGEQGLLYKRKHDTDYYFRAFLDGLIHRDNCFNCKYAQPNRVSDITIGDFWGLNRNTMKTDYPGKVSVALINTRKGEGFFDEVNEFFTVEQRPIKEAVDGNEQLRRPSLKPKDREKFALKYKELGFINALKETDIKKEIEKTKIRDVMVFPYRLSKRIMKDFFKSTI